MKKFGLVTELSKEFFGKKLFRIRALISFSDVKEGDLGGWVEKADNISQEDDAWVYGDARVYGDAWVCGNAQVCGDAYWLTVGPAGSENGHLTAFRQKDNSIAIRRGCFSGTIDEFEAAVKERHGDNESGKQYLALIPFIKLRLKEAGTDCAPLRKGDGDEQPH